MDHYHERFPSIPAAVRHSAAIFGDKTYLVDGELEWSFTQLGEYMLQAARAFIALGIQPGDRVALLGPNTALWIQAALGIHAAGGVLVPLNTRYKGSELAHILNKSGAAAVVTVGDFLGIDHVGMMRAAASDAPALGRIVVLDGAVIPGTTTFTDFLAAGAAVPEAAVTARIDALGQQDLSDILFTSGTTGAPKGVRIRHGQSVRIVHWLCGAFTVSDVDVHAIVPPFFHASGYKAGWLGAIFAGAMIVPVQTFDTAGLFEIIQKHRVSVLFGPPTMFVDMVAHPARTSFDLSSLRAANVASAGSPLSLIRDVHDVLGFDVVINAYGQTEANALITTCRADDPLELVAVSVGRPIDDVEVIVVDDDEHEVPPGEPGELLVRGYNVMDAYWDEPGETAKTLRADGFLRTGDIGTKDENGYLRITDRKKDMYIVGGFNAYPAEIEAVLTKHPQILHAAVIGMPDERMGEIGWAYVTTMVDASITEREVIDYCRENMANFKVPRRVLFVDELPRNATLKVLKFDLRQQAKALLESEAAAT
ncbi:MAG: long-chain fatty acid--CoA ligase [Microbacteriaceae bacterium]|nr:long-chain fatty acid--CoA ligase [Microbacteriaceae bacterium]